MWVRFTSMLLEVGCVPASSVSSPCRQECPTGAPPPASSAHRGPWPGPQHAARPASCRSHQRDHRGRHRTTPRLPRSSTSSPPTPGSRPATNATDDARHRSSGGSRYPTSTRSARQLRSTGRRCATPPRTCPAPPRQPRRDPSSGDEASPPTTADAAHTTRATPPGHHRRSRRPAPHHSTMTDPHSRLYSRATTTQRFTRWCSPPVRRSASTPSHAPQCAPVAEMAIRALWIEMAAVEPSAAASTTWCGVGGGRRMSPAAQTVGRLVAQVSSVTM